MKYGLIIMILCLSFFSLGLAGGVVHERNKQCEYEKIIQSNIKEAIVMAGRVYRVQPCLIAAVIKAESSFRPEAVSPRGAEGLMQLMPNTALELGVEDTFNPAENILGGAQYLREMYDQFGTWRLAVIAYNWGPGNLRQFGAEHMPKETRDYLRRVEIYYGKPLN